MGCACSPASIVSRVGMLGGIQSFWNLFMMSCECDWSVSDCVSSVCFGSFSSNSVLKVTACSVLKKQIKKCFKLISGSVSSSCVAKYSNHSFIFYDFVHLEHIIAFSKGCSLFKLSCWMWLYSLLFIALLLVQYVFLEMQGQELHIVFCLWMQ